MVWHPLFSILHSSRDKISSEAYSTTRVCHVFLQGYCVKLITIYFQLWSHCWAVQHTKVSNLLLCLLTSVKCSEWSCVINTKEMFFSSHELSNWLDTDTESNNLLLICWDLVTATQSFMYLDLVVLWNDLIYHVFFLQQ